MRAAESLFQIRSFKKMKEVKKRDEKKLFPRSGYLVRLVDKYEYTLYM